MCREATQHFAIQQELSFLSDLPPPPAPTVVDSSASDPAAAAADSDAASKDATQLNKAPRDWISNAQSVDLVWLYFALHKHYHQAK